MSEWQRQHLSDKADRHMQAYRIGERTTMATKAVKTGAAKHANLKPSAAEKTRSEEKEFVPEFDAIHGLRSSKLPEIVQEHDRLARRIAVDQARLKELKAQGAEMMVKAGVKVVMCAGLRVTQIDGVSSKLDKAQLVKDHGTKVLQWLRAATVQTKYISLRVKEPGAGGNDGGEEE